MTEKKYDVVIIGSGPAGMTAAMYTARSEMKTLLLERGVPGGQMNNTAEIENYPGYETIMGPELSMKMAEPLEGLGVENAYGFVTAIEDHGDYKKLSQKMMSLSLNQLLLRQELITVSLKFPVRKNMELAEFPTVPFVMVLSLETKKF